MERDDVHSRYSDLTAFSEKLHQVRERVAGAARRSGREPASVTVIAVTKTQAAEQVAVAVRAGLSDIGENYIQEAQTKRPGVIEILQGATLPTWHFIGHLQSNKARFAVDFDLIHTVDSAKLATEIDKQAAKRDKVQAVLIEVNTARDAERAGVLAEDALKLVEHIERLPNVSLRGLMTIAPVTDDAQVRAAFRQMRDLWDHLPEPARQVLSMGMSGDFETAIEEGATHIRLGTVLFGARPTRAV